jgi:hypothetical protein
VRRFLQLILLASCAPPALTDFPEPSTLAENAELPDLFLSATSADRATTAEAWEAWRKPQLAALFSHYQYGFTPEPVSVHSNCTQRPSQLRGTGLPGSSAAPGTAGCCRTGTRR